MIDITLSQESGPHGNSISDESGSIIYWEGAGSGAPSFQAPLGSQYVDIDNGKKYVKLGVLATDWLEFVSAVFQGITPPLLLNHNGILSNGQLIGMTNLVNNPVVIGFRSKLVKVTYINKKATSDADFRLYKDLELAPNLFHTMSFINKLTTVETIAGSPIFEVGDLLRIYFDDTGQNPSDMTMGLYLEAVPL